MGFPYSVGECESAERSIANFTVGKMEAEHGGDYVNIIPCYERTLWSEGSVEEGD
jgi:hypothetical protein